MDALPIISTFLLIHVAELDDKTQLAVISLSSNYKATHVFAGARVLKSLNANAADCRANR
jgi:putative Ca2+/H+ antiporter (TMEM165/GDT1 family)